jgi:DNA-binding CsgD family transcriptional regulator
MKAVKIAPQRNNSLVDQEVWNTQFYKLLMESRNYSKFIDTIYKVLRRTGFTDFSCVRINPKGDVVGAGEEVVTMPTKLLTTYYEEAFNEHDIILDALRADFIVPFFQSNIRDQLDNHQIDTLTAKRNRDIFRLNESYKYQDYYLIPIRACNGHGKMLLSITAKGASSAQVKKNAAKYSQFLSVFAEAIDYIATQKFPDEYLLFGNQKKKPVLSPRVLEYLNLVAKEGLKNKEIADRMNISLPTAKKYSKIVREVFGTTTLSSAVYRAIRRGVVIMDSKK